MTTSPARLPSIHFVTRLVAELHVEGEQPRLKQELEQATRPALAGWARRLWGAGD